MDPSPPPQVFRMAVWMLGEEGLLGTGWGAAEKPVGSQRHVREVVAPSDYLPPLFRHHSSPLLLHHPCYCYLFTLV
jgi:hypothetical protein